MKCKDFSKIKFLKHKYYKPNKIQKELIAFDTETEKGKCGILANNRNISYIGFDIDKIFEYMTDQNYLKTVNVFFNLEYDTNAIIKHLPKTNLISIGRKNETQYKDYHISIIPGKNLRIDFNDKSWRYYDLWQFFKYEKNSSLDALSEKYLKENKIDIEEITGIKKSDYTIKDFREVPEILEYCLKDCDLTYRLGKMVIDACDTIQLTFNKPYSCATLSTDYFYGLKGLKSPYWFYFNGSSYNRDVTKYAFNSYHGGRFEVLQKGYFENIYEYDINSAYPDAQTKLLDILSTKFHYAKNEQVFDSFREKDTFFAFVKIKIKQNNDIINLLPYDNEGVLIYPKGDFQTYVIYPELCLLDRYNIEYEIIDGYIGTIYDKTYPYRDIIKYIFSERKKYPKSDFRSSLYKILMNSGYGKNIEININLDNVSDTDLLQLMIDDENKDIISKSYTAGKYFNPCYASYITGLTRCKLYDTIMKNDPENVIGMFTDSIISKEPLKLKEGNELGEWELSKKDICVMVGTGLYFMENFDNKEKKIRTRGFHFMGMKDFSFEDFLEGKYKVKKSIKLKESIIQDRMEDFNVILEQDKEVNINFDNKRIWDRNFKNVKDIYDSQIKSRCITI